MTEPSTPSADVLTREQIATLGKLLDLMDDLTEVRMPAEWQMKLYEFMDTMESEVRDALRALLRSLAQGDVRKLWLWRNFVDGRPEYWAFDNPYPCFQNGDPMTLGEPCGYAIVKDSTRGRNDTSDEQVIAAIRAALAAEQPERKEQP